MFKKNFLIPGILMVFCLLPNQCSIAHSKFPHIWNVPQKNDYFTGRTETLTKLKHFFSKDPIGIFAITGLSGIGKTQIVKTFAHLNHGDYEIIWWFDAAQDMQSQFYEFAVAWNEVFSEWGNPIPLRRLSLEGLINLMKNRLRKTKSSWLMIFDNVKNKGDLLAYLPPVHLSDIHLKHILVTSQNQNGWANKEVIKFFTPKEAFDFIQKTLPTEPSVTIQKLVELVGHHPFYLAKAIDYIKSNELSIINYIHLYKAGREELKKKEEELLTQETPSLDLQGAKMEKTLLINREDLKKHEPEAYEILVFLSVFRGTSIPENILKEFVRHKNFKRDFLGILRDLKEYSFIEETESKNEDQKFYSIHEIVRAIVLKGLEQEKEKKHITTGIQLFLNILDQRWDRLTEFTSKNPAMIAKASALSQLAFELDIKSEALFALGKVLLEYHMYQTRHQKTYEELYKNLEVLLLTLGDQKISPKTLMPYFIDCVYSRSLYFSPEKVLMVKERMEKAVHFFKNSGDIEEYCRALYNMAQFYLFQGKIQEAKQYIQRVEDWLPQSTSLSNKNLFLYVKAWIFQEAGNYELSNKTLDILINSFAEEHNYTLKLYSLNLRAANFYELGDYQTALEWAQVCLKEAQKFFQTEFNEVSAEALTTIASSLIETAHLSEAEQKIRKAIDIYSDYFGGYGQHADQAHAVQLLGLIHEKRGFFEKALKEYQAAAAIYTALYKGNTQGLQHLSEVFQKLALIGIKLKNDEITHRYLKLHIENFGLGHEGTKKIFKELDENKLPSVL